MDVVRDVKGRFIRRPSCRFDDLTGRKFGRLTVVRIAGYKKEKGGTHILWLCRCRCQKRVVTIGRDMKHGKTQSCGCLQRQRVVEHNEDLVTHGHTRRQDGRMTTPTYRSWQSMKGRCLNPNNPAWLRYGGANPPIKVIRCWLGKNGFNQFKKDMGTRPSIHYSLSRRLDKGDYRPGNVYWGTRADQVAEAKKLRLQCGG